jgi:hypothetical protein
MTIIAEDSPKYLFDVKGVTVLPEPRDTIDTGLLAESKFSTQAISRGYISWWPMGHNQKADVCVWKAPYRPITVQVKLGQLKGESWQIYVAASRGGKDRRRAKAAGRDVDKYQRYQIGDFDVLAMYVPTADAFRFWRLRDVAGTLCLYVSDLSTLNNWHVIEDALKHDL